VEPTRFPREVLDSKRAEYGASGYALQFMLDTNPSEVDKHPLKLRDLIIDDIDSELGHVKLVWGQDREQVLQNLHAGGFDGDVYHAPAFKADEMAKFTGTVMAIDPSGRGNDETAYAIVRYLYGTLFLVSSAASRTASLKQRSRRSLRRRCATASTTSCAKRTTAAACSRNC
jgi:hypothetical protein